MVQVPSEEVPSFRHLLMPKNKGIVRCGRQFSGSYIRHFSIVCFDCPRRMSPNKCATSWTYVLLYDYGLPVRTVPVNQYGLAPRRRRRRSHVTSFKLPGVSSKMYLTFPCCQIDFPDIMEQQQYPHLHKNPLGNIYPSL